MPTEIIFIFMKFEGCILSSIGASSIPVSRQADKTLIVFENFKICSGQTKRYLASLNEDVALPDIYLENFSRFFVF